MSHSPRIAPRSGHPSSAQTSLRAFTLIELLTVIAIIGILAAIIIPTISKVRETARRADAISKVRQAILATLSYGNENRGKPPAPALNASGNPTFGGTPHSYPVDAYNATLKPYLGDRFIALYASRAMAQIDDYNPDKQREKEAAGDTPKDHVHLVYFQRDALGQSGQPKSAYRVLFKDLNNPPMDYAIWGTMAFSGNSRMLSYAEVNTSKAVTPFPGMFAGYADASVKWFKFEQLSIFSSDNCYYWPKPKNEP